LDGVYGHCKQFYRYSVCYFWAKPLEGEQTFGRLQEVSRHQMAFQRLPPIKDWKSFYVIVNAINLWKRRNHKEHKEK
jgi:hypothetical protein